MYNPVSTDPRRRRFGRAPLIYTRVAQIGVAVVRFGESARVSGSTLDYTMKVRLVGKGRRLCQRHGFALSSGTPIRIVPGVSILNQVTNKHASMPIIMMCGVSHVLLMYAPTFRGPHGLLDWETLVDHGVTPDTAEPVSPAATSSKLVSEQPIVGTKGQLSMASTPAAPSVGSRRSSSRHRSARGGGSSMSLAPKA